MGAILTQNTAWTNVEKAIANLVAHDRLDAGRIVAARNDHLANWLRPSGYFNVKAVRLKNFCRWYLEAGGYRTLSRMEHGRVTTGVIVHKRCWPRDGR